VSRDTSEKEVSPVFVNKRSVEEGGVTAFLKRRAESSEDAQRCFEDSDT